jgi:MFS family permease
MTVSRTWPLVMRLGTAQTLAWGSTYYLPALLARPMADGLGLPISQIWIAFTVALLASAALGPFAGRAIDRWGGRPVLMGTSVLFALGLASLSQVQGSTSLMLAWLLIGTAMGSGLYEAAFSALVRLQGTHARAAITGITLIAGFASTVGWPLTALLEAEFGWRGACLAWAGLHARRPCSRRRRLSMQVPPAPCLTRRRPDTRPGSCLTCSPPPGSSAPPWLRTCRNCWWPAAPRWPAPWRSVRWWARRRWPGACWSSASCVGCTPCSRRALRPWPTRWV